MRLGDIFAGGYFKFFAIAQKQNEIVNSNSNLENYRELSFYSRVVLPVKDFEFWEFDKKLFKIWILKGCLKESK